VAVTAVLALGGCTVPTGGVAAIGVDAAGALVGHLLVCEPDAHLDGATLYDTTASDDEYGTWGAPRAVTDATSFSLGDPESGWTTVEPLGELQPGVVYAFYGWSSDNSWSAMSVEFTTEDLAMLRPGELVYDEYDAATHEWGHGVSEVETFRREGCAGW